MHFDGSYTPDTDQNVAQAAYGVAVARPSCNQIDEYCAPVSTIPFHANFRGANRLSNNVAEVHGAILALEIIGTSHQVASLSVTTLNMLGVSLQVNGAHVTMLD